MDKNATRKTIKLQFLYFSVSILLIMCSYSGLADLQSSINIKDGLGTISLTVTYSTTIGFSLFVTPIVVHQWGAKTLILISEACFLVYVIANFYPRFFTLIPAGVVLGFGEATLFTPALMYCTYYGRTFANVGKKPVNVYTKQFIGYFYCIVQINEVISNLISYIVLRVGRTLHEKNHLRSSKFNDSFQELCTDDKIHINNHEMKQDNYTVDNITMFGNCGAADCYDETVIEITKDQYVPISSVALYIMISILTTLGISAIILFAYCVPNLPVEEIRVENTKAQNDLVTKNVNEEFDLMNISNVSPQETVVMPSRSKNSIHIVYSTISKTFRHVADAQQLLLTPLTLYHGMYIIFVSSEVNRAYVSCVVGVEQVGIAMVIGGVSNVLTALMFGAFSDKCASRFLLILAVVVDISCYTFCLLWEPAINNSWFTYVLCCLLVSTDGIWQPFLDAKYADYFSDNEEIAFAISNLWTCTGFTIMYGWSTLICMREKIYTLIMIMIIGLLCYGIAEHRRKDRKNKSLPDVLIAHVGPSSRL